MTLDWMDLARLLAAVAAGALIGLERELHDKPAGFRTNILICLGAALFTLVSIRLGDASGVDRTRIAAQIVTGVGFLGAGAIVQHRSHVLGLTTAATIWAVASVGMACGAGEFTLATLGTVLTTGVLFGLGPLESRIDRWRSEVTWELDLDATPGARASVEQLVAAAGLRRRSWTLSKTPDKLTAQLTVIGPTMRLEKLEEALLREPSIYSVRRL